MHMNLKRILIAAAVTMMLGGVTAAPAQAASTDPVWRTIHPALKGEWCLDSGKAGTGGYADRGSVYMTRCANGNVYQQWRIARVHVDGNPLRISSVGTGMCLDGDKSRLYTRPCSPTGTNKNQLWHDQDESSNFRTPGSLVECPRNSATGKTWSIPQYGREPLYSINCSEWGADNRKYKTWFSAVIYK